MEYSLQLQPNVSYSNLKVSIFSDYFLEKKVWKLVLPILTHNGRLARVLFSRL
jgi:hypothetical protein